MSLVIVDTGCANLASVGFAFDRLGVSVLVTDNAEIICSAERVIIPGVGAAPYAMDKINAKGLTPVLQSLAQPVMGICLGMQLIYETLEEGGTPVKGLGLVPGSVTALNTKDQPSPHMGWNSLTKMSSHPLLDDIYDGDYAYFVHSYAAPVTDNTLAYTEYGAAFSAIVNHNNIYGCQFHPERSAKIGAKILENFLKVPA